VNSHLGLARNYQRQEKYSQALAETDAAKKIDPARPDVHYSRARVLQAMGRKDESKKELDAAHKIDKETENNAQPANLPSPELLEDMQ
jgi:Tfp pilus assembly protein PilF